MDTWAAVELENGFVGCDVTACTFVLRRSGRRALVVVAVCYGFVVLGKPAKLGMMIKIVQTIRTKLTQLTM